MIEKVVTLPFSAVLVSWIRKKGVGEADTNQRNGDMCREGGGLFIYLVN